MGIHEAYILPAIMDVALAGLRDEREQLVGRAAGRVLEVGVGNGANLPFYPDAAREVVALEPCATVLARAQKRLGKQARQQPGIDLARYAFVRGGAEQMDFEDDSFDTAVACLVFCTIPAAQRAASEVFRVLKPGGKLLFLEHVRCPPGTMQRVQNAINPAWKVFACGCHLNRDTEALFSDAGFAYNRIERYRNPKMSPPFAAYMIKGEALKPV
ncbi:MAG: class I SAM-dependent methyltransferase [Halioglobus sp.]|nr:class I SAM-dependent methyltransferase [Halioglobus sp.]